MLRPVEKRTGRTVRAQSTGENRYEATRQRDLRDFSEAVRKGHDNQAVRERMRK